MHIIIDPPVDEFSAPEAIRAWIRELAALAQQHRDDETALGYIRASHDRAVEWLQFAEERERR